MAKKSSAASQPINANVNTTELEVPQTMHIESTHEDGEAPPVFKDDVRESIFAKRRKMLEDEVSGQSGLEKQETIEENPAEEAELPSQQALSEEVAPVEEGIGEEPAAGSSIPERVKIKVEGKDVDVPFDTLVSLAQKGMSADARFQEAARQREEAQRLMFAMQSNQNAQPQQVAPHNAQQEQSSLSKIIPDIAKRINYGSEEEQRQALLDYGAAITAGLRDEANPLPPEQLIHVATQRAVDTIRLEQEQETLKKEFPDILVDYPLAMATDTIANQLAYKYQTEGKTLSRLELFMEAGKIARDRYIPKQVSQAQHSPPVQAASPQVSNMDTRIERKRAAPKPPAAANKVSEAPAQQYGSSPASIVNQMRKSRGQPVY